MITCGSICHILGGTSPILFDTLQYVKSLPWEHGDFMDLGIKKAGVFLSHPQISCKLNSMYTIVYSSLPKKT